MSNPWRFLPAANHRSGALRACSVSSPPTQSEDSVRPSSWLTPRGTYCPTIGLVYTDGDSPKSELDSSTGQESVAGGAGHLQSAGAVHAQGTRWAQDPQKRPHQLQLKPTVRLRTGQSDSRVRSVHSAALTHCWVRAPACNRNVRAPCFSTALSSWEGWLTGSPVSDVGACGGVGGVANPAHTAFHVEIIRSWLFSTSGQTEAT